MSKVIGLGACVYDTLIKSDFYPIEDKKMKANGVFVSGGGPVGNALVVLSKLGVQASVFGLFSDDIAGKYLLNDFCKYGVDTSKTKTVPNTSAFCSFIVLSNDTQSRTCIFDRGTVPDNPNLIDAELLQGADVLHLDGNYLQCAIKCAKYCKQHGITVSLDAGGLYNGIEALLPYVDVLIPSAEFALGLTGKSDIEEAMVVLQQRYNPKVLVVTNGVDGSYYFQDGKVNKVNAIIVDAVDTNGCGDTYHGAFLSAYLQGKSVGECCEFATAVSAYKCLHYGARSYELNQQIIKDFINKKA